MRTAVLVPVEEYLSSTYRPDMDYVDGELRERNVGEREHAITQKRLIILLDRVEAKLGICAFPEARIQVSDTRFRVSDVCVYRGSGPRDRIFRTPPFLCIEILSPEDRMGRMDERLEDYFSFGVEYVWIVDPLRRTASIHTRQGSQPVRDGVLRTSNPEIELPLADVFSTLD